MRGPSLHMKETEILKTTLRWTLPVQVQKTTGTYTKTKVVYHYEQVCID